MDTLDIRNLQLSYQAIYDEVLCESMEDLGIIGEARDGYGDDSKFNKPDDMIEKPGTTVPKPKKGGYGRISRSTPYGIGAHANRTASNVTKIVGEDPGAPRAVKMPREESKKKGPKMVKKDGKWVKEAHDYYDLILSHLLDEGYANDIESAEAIMVNMSEEWVGDIMEVLDTSQRRVSYILRAMKSGLDAENRGDMKTHKKRLKGIKMADRKSRTAFNKAMLKNSYDYYDLILSHLLDEGYANDIESAEAIMVNMSEEWVGDIVEGYKTLPVGKMMKQAARKIKTAEKKRSDSGWPAEIAGKPNWMTRKALKDVDKMARVASRHSLIKGKGRVRGEGQAELNRRRGERVKEALDYYDMILEHLLEGGYAETVENAEAIMVNMSEEWVGDIVEEVLDEELTGKRKKRALKKGFKHLATAKEGSSVTKNMDKNIPTRRGGDTLLKRNPSRWGKPGSRELNPERLNPNPDQGSGNRAARRAGKKVKDNEDRYYWNDKDENF